MKKRLIYILSFISLTIVTNAQNTSVLEFDGNDSYFVSDVSNKLDLPGSDWTIEAWIHPTLASIPGGGSFPAIISRKHSFEIYFRNTGGNLGVGLRAFDGSSSGFGFEGSVNSGANFLTLNEWHHIAISSSFSGTRITKIFFDGIEVGTSSDPDFDLDGSASAIHIGARFSSGSFIRYIDGCALDEIRYSDVARYSSNFTINTFTTPHVTDGNTILLYSLNENMGSSVSNDNDSDFDVNLRSSPNDPTWRTWDYYTANLPLPILYHKQLSAIKHGKEILLQWSTSSEINNSRFEIQKRTIDNRWESLGFIKGDNYSNIIKEYEFIDIDPMSNNYYRLKQIDKNGKYSFSSIVFISFDIKRSIEIFPNPVVNTLNINMGNIEENLSYEIYNISGQKIQFGIIQPVGMIDVSSLIKGSYVLRFSINHGVNSIPFSVIK